MKNRKSYKIVSDGNSVDYTLDKTQAERTFNYFMEEWGECKLWEFEEEFKDNDWQIIEENIIMEENKN